MKAKHLIIFLLTLFASSFSLKAQNANILIVPPFQIGEELTYRFRYGIFNCAEGTMRVEESPKEFNHIKPYRLIAKGETVSAVALITKVRNRYDSYVSPTTLKPFLFTESVREGTYKRDGYASFDHKNKVVNSTKGSFPIGDNTLDVLSVLYYARSLDFANIKKGGTIKFDFFLDDHTYPIAITYLGNETIKTPFGKISCMKFSPTVVEGRVFRKNSKMYLWVTNDANRVPVRAEVEILIGSLRLDLTNYKNLKYPVGSNVSDGNQRASN
ncbi:DUF3108 domain-containing protein [Solitalea sp. MAHUQ-68]|uniref:DUF3108 domain-containing protein n=1 Tax=Solitalea agri TaxID=2953739 RepID=A0A9X2F658_9SPHI|nr:DUF3108 domain-containing protein [Solitalea agri]MCO4293101.1 DUF3108 domain-containing protein [Solitalea agri]